MWIIPRNLHTLASVQDTEALISDSDELSELYAQSLLARSKASQPKTWSRRLKRGSLTLLPYGRTLRPSRGDAFEDEWTSCQEASLVSHSQPQDEGQETKILDTSSPTLPQESDPWGTLPLFSSRMLRESSAQSSRETDGPTLRERPFCSMSSENWSAWVTRRRREYSARARSVRPISASACSSWVVAPISAQKDEGSLIGCSERQNQRTLPTPHQEAQSSTLGSPQESRWATPTTRDYKGMYPQWSQESENKRTRNLLPDQAHGGTYRGKLNPRWVETLMGLPVGWCMPSCATPWTIEQMNCGCSGTGSSPQQQSGPSESCGHPLEEALGPDIMRRFNKLTESLGIPNDDAEANMFALDQVLSNRDCPSFDTESED